MLWTATLHLLGIASPSRVYTQSDDSVATTIFPAHVVLLQMVAVSLIISLLFLVAGRKRKWFPVEEALQQLALHKPVQLTYLQALITCKNDKVTWSSGRFRLMKSHGRHSRAVVIVAVASGHHKWRHYDYCLVLKKKKKNQFQLAICSMVDSSIFFSKKKNHYPPRMAVVLY